MDRVRFGRALGMGAREAARAMLKAADAATAPNPTPPTRSTPVREAARATAQATSKTVHHVRTTSTGLKLGTKRFGAALWGPITKLSGVVMLEVTGVLFSLFAITAALEVWKHHADLHAAGPARNHLFFAILMLVVFGYFTVSSFVRANRRSRL